MSAADVTYLATQQHNTGWWSIIAIRHLSTHGQMTAIEVFINLWMTIINKKTPYSIGSYNSRWIKKYVRLQTSQANKTLAVSFYIIIFNKHYYNKHY